MEDQDNTTVLIMTDKYRIVGKVELLPGSRLTDYLSESKGFIALTDAEIWNLENRKLLSSRFLDINRDHIEVIMPEDAVTQGLWRAAG